MMQRVGCMYINRAYILKRVRKLVCTQAAIPSHIILFMFIILNTTCARSGTLHFRLQEIIITIHIFRN